MTIFEELLKLHVFDNERINVNAQRIVKRNPKIHAKIERSTKFLGEASLKERISAVFQKIDSRPVCLCGGSLRFEERGKPRYRGACSSACAARLRINSIGPGGMMSVIAKRNATMSCRDSSGKTGFDRTYERQHQTKVKKGICVDRSLLSERRKYSAACWKATKQNDLSALPNFHLRGPNGKIGAYQIDHRISISYGFVNGVDPSVIGHWCNLEMIPWESNAQKNFRCSITLQHLKERISEHQG